MADGKIEVFQDLHLRGSVSNRSKLRIALIEAATSPWRHNTVQEKKIVASTGTNEDVIVFEREESDGVDAVELSLWSNNDGFTVTNIVPREFGSLGEHRYNLVLQDFVNRIATSATPIAGFEVQITPPRQGLDDWLSPDVAKALRQFSGAANKSSGSNHPLDRSRWLIFLVGVHRAGSLLDTGLLIRWFNEVEHWPHDIAQDLGSEYEFALELLHQYNKDVP